MTNNSVLPTLPKDADFVYRTTDHSIPPEFDGCSLCRKPLHSGTSGQGGRTDKQVSHLESFAFRSSGRISKCRIYGCILESVVFRSFERTPWWCCFQSESGHVYAKRAKTRGQGFARFANVFLTLAGAFPKGRFSSGR